MISPSIGLFVNAASTITASVMNARRGMLDIRFALPLVVAVLVATPFGASSSQFVPERTVQWALALFVVLLLLLAANMIFDLLAG